jgi:hypothetical protein
MEEEEEILFFASLGEHLQVSSELHKSIIFSIEESCETSIATEEGEIQPIGALSEDEEDDKMDDFTRNMSNPEDEDDEQG